MHLIVNTHNMPVSVGSVLSEGIPVGYTFWIMLTVVSTNILRIYVFKP